MVTAGTADSSPRPLVFLHGALGAREQLLPLARVLCGDDRILAPDFSGHGAKAGHNAEFGIPRFSADLIGFLDAEGMDKADIFGYSMGGYVALHAALRNPGRIGRIMTLGTKFDWNETVSRREAGRLDPAVMEKKIPAFTARLRDLHGDAWKGVVEATARMMLELGGAPALTEHELGKIEHPVLVCVGDRDEMVTIEETVNVYRRLRQASLWVLPGTGHPLERVDAGMLAGRIRDFFGRGRSREASPNQNDSLTQRKS